MPEKRKAKATKAPKMQWAPDSPLAQIWSRSLHDSKFRTRLLKDPRATLEDEMGVMLPEKMKVSVVENSSSQYTIVLPQADGPMSDPDVSAISMAGVCYVYHIPEHNFAVDIGSKGLRAKGGSRGFGKNPHPRSKKSS